MKLKLFNTLALLFVAFTLLLTSCSKEGPAGPAGATGPAGPQGPAGSNGATGPAGAPGTANVIYSAWLNVTYKPLYTDSSAWIATISAPKLVDSILNKGEIKVYLNAGSDSVGGQFIVPLPIYDPFAVGDIINPYFERSKITLVATGDESSFKLRNYNYFQYRYILIPGGTSSGRMANIDWNDYKQVKEYLGLRD